MAKFPSLKAKKMLAILKRNPLNYRIEKSVGSHKKLVSLSGYPTIRFTFHDKATLAPDAVRKILVIDIGLTEQEALNVL